MSNAMAVSLPSLSFDEFRESLGRALPFGITREVSERLWGHYEELARWSPRLSLIGAGTAADVVKRHYAESLLALPLIEGVRSLLDLGSGAGFPGFVLAAARPDLEVTLVEARHRKAVFLRSAAHRASLSCRVLNATLGPSLPAEMSTSFDAITVRAVRLGSAEWAAVNAGLVAGGRLLRWIGPAVEPPPRGFALRRTVEIGNSRRAIQELVKAGNAGGER
jgi:16S rRNA (guanine527-N7)-methyltransferase